VLRVGEISGADIDVTNYNDEKRVYYNAEWSGKIYYELVLYCPDQVYDIERAKVDWYAESAGAGDKLTNVKLVQVKIMESQIAMTESV